MAIRILGEGFGLEVFLSSIGSVLGNSAPAANPFGSITGFGQSSSTSTGGFSFGASKPNAGFGTTNSVIFGTPSPSNDQMNMEDSMAEDVVQTSAPVIPAFGQPTSSTSPYMFSSPPPSGGPPFMFGGQQNPVTPQMPNPFQPPPGEFGLGGTGSFSLGSTGGGDKSGRKIIKVMRDKLRKR